MVPRPDDGTLKGVPRTPGSQRFQLSRRVRWLSWSGAPSIRPMSSEKRGPRERLVFPLDFSTLAEAREAAELLAPAVGVMKVGLELFVREGPAATRLGVGCEVFLDLKLHDIPETVERAVAGAGALGVRYLTVHAAGGDGDRCSAGGGRLQP